MKVLQVIEDAYRGTIEEQDDTIVWLTQSMRQAGGELSVLLNGNAVAYAIEGQDASGLRFGSWAQTHPPRVDKDLEKLVRSGVAIYVVDEDLRRRGLSGAKLVAGLKVVPRTDVPALFESHDQVWHW